MSDKTPIFIGGVGRSGTTLLRVILDSHSNIACGPELKVFAQLVMTWHNIEERYKNSLLDYGISSNDTKEIFSEMMYQFLEKYRIKQNKNRIAEKSPNNVVLFSHLHYLFPKSPLIHVIRDGRDVIASLLTMDWLDHEGKPVPYTKDPKQAALYWRDVVKLGRNFQNYSQSNRESYFEIKYEDLINSPETTLKELFNFINEPWEEEVLSFHKKNRNLANESSADQVSQKMYKTAIGRWKEDLSKEQIAIIKPLIEDLLIELGYENDTNW